MDVPIITFKHGDSSLPPKMIRLSGEEACFVDNVTDYADKGLFSWMLGNGDPKAVSLADFFSVLRDQVISELRFLSTVIGVDCQGNSHVGVDIVYPLSDYAPLLEQQLYACQEHFSQAPGYFHISKDSVLHVEGANLLGMQVHFGSLDLDIVRYGKHAESKDRLSQTVFARTVPVPVERAHGIEWVTRSTLEAMLKKEAAGPFAFGRFAAEGSWTLAHETAFAAAEAFAFERGYQIAHPVVLHAKPPFLGYLTVEFYRRI